jgi:hypothetical protein
MTIQLGLGFSGGLFSPTEGYVRRILPPPHPGYARPEECGAQAHPALWSGLMNAEYKARP